MGFVIIGKYLPLIFVASITLYNIFKGCLKLTKRCNWSINCQYVLDYILQKMSLTGIPLFFYLVLKSPLWFFPHQDNCFVSPFPLPISFCCYCFCFSYFDTQLQSKIWVRDLINCRNSFHQHPSHWKSHMHLKIYLDHGLCPKIIILIYLGLLG